MATERKFIEFDRMLTAVIVAAGAAPGDPGMPVPGQDLVQQLLRSHYVEEAGLDAVKINCWLNNRRELLAMTGLIAERGSRGRSKVTKYYRVPLDQYDTFLQRGVFARNSELVRKPKA